MTTPAPLTFGSLFSGIGGFDLGMERAGLVCKWQVEKDPFCQKVLAKHWPHVPRFGDIHDVGKHNLESVDVICGGFPCQPFSSAGKQLGQADDRFLWPEMLRIVQELKPRWVIGENVTGFIGLYLDKAIIDLETQGYEAWPVVLPACAFDAPHIRKRIFIIAYADFYKYQGGSSQNGRAPSEVLPMAYTDNGRSQRTQNEIRPRGHVAELSGKTVADSNGERQPQPQGANGQERGRTGDGGQIMENSPSRRKWEYQDPRGTEGSQSEPEQSGWWATEPAVGRVADGIPHRVDRLRGLGNAVVPQIPEILGRLIVTVTSNYLSSGFA